MQNDHLPVALQMLFDGMSTGVIADALYDALGATRAQDVYWKLYHKLPAISLGELDRAWFDERLVCEDRRFTGTDADFMEHVKYWEPSDYVGDAVSREMDDFIKHMIRQGLVEDIPEETTPEVTP